MDEADSPEDRLEAALARIATRIDAPDPVKAKVVARLDTIIADLRDALDEAGDR